MKDLFALGIFAAAAFMLFRFVVWYYDQIRFNGAGFELLLGIIVLVAMVGIGSVLFGGRG